MSAGSPRSKFPLLVAFAVLWMALPLGAQQFRGSQPASIEPPAPLELKPGEEAEITLTVRIRPQYHINSNKPREEYLIPTRLEWETGPLKVLEVEYPEGEIVRYEFSQEPLSVYSHRAEIRTTFEAPQKIPSDFKELRGKLRYQACTEKACLPPKTIDVTAPVVRQ